MGKKIKAKFISETAQLKAVRSFIEHCCKNAPGDSERLCYELQLATDEAFCNIIEHSYQGQSGKNILLETEILEEGILVRISDQGNIFDPYKIPEPNFNGEKEEGFGWYIIKKIAESVSYNKKETQEGWNHLCIFKRFYSKRN